MKMGPFVASDLAAGMQAQTVGTATRYARVHISGPTTNDEHVVPLAMLGSKAGPNTAAMLDPAIAQNSTSKCRVNIDRK
jgi:hypothetical protein